METDHQAVAKLTERLAATPRQSIAESRALHEKHKNRIQDAMWNEGKTYGEAIGGLEFLGKASTPAYLKSIKDDLGRQTEICNEVLDQHFQMGEPIAPHYFFRVALILRKQKAFDLEREFIQSFALHLYGARGSSFEKMTARADKLGVAPENPPIWPERGSAN